jgi:hypothetical protein
MMKMLWLCRYRFFAGFVLSSLMAVSQAQELNSRWRLHVTDLKHQVKVEATIRFSGETASESCMSGAWKRIVVEAKTVHDEEFFPLAEPLAYTRERGELTLGRTAVCDGYLFLSGKPNGSHIKGAYNAVSIGSADRLGYFSLKRIH